MTPSEQAMAKMIEAEERIGEADEPMLPTVTAMGYALLAAQLWAKEHDKAAEGGRLTLSQERGARAT